MSIHWNGEPQTSIDVGMTIALSKAVALTTHNKESPSLIGKTNLPYLANYS
jgi:hypothetical protein